MPHLIHRVRCLRGLHEFSWTHGAKIDAPRAACRHCDSVEPPLGHEQVPASVIDRYRKA